MGTTQSLQYLLSVTYCWLECRNDFTNS